MPDPRAYRTLEFMRTTFLNSLSDLARDDQRRVIRALEQLDADERILSLRVHQMKGSRAGLWSASASRSLRIAFLRLEGGRKLLVECSHHYGDQAHTPGVKALESHPATIFPVTA